jgi:hypothetical protein
MLPDGWQIVVPPAPSANSPPDARPVTPLIPSVTKAMYDAQRRDRRLDFGDEAQTPVPRLAAETGLGALLVLVAGDAAHAHGTDNLAVDRDRHATW